MAGDLSLAQAVSPATSALLVVDMQNDGVHPDGAFGKRGWGVSSALEIVPTIKRLAEEARRAGVTVIVIRNVRSEITAWPALDRLSRRIMGDDYLPVCVEGTWGAEFYEGLEPQPGDIVVDKNRYSAFFGTNLDIILRNKGIKTLIMSGTATNVCVETTARHGFLLDYDIVMVDDACAAPTREFHEATMALARRWLGRVEKAEDVIAAWVR